MRWPPKSELAKLPPFRPANVPGDPNGYSVWAYDGPTGLELMGVITGVPTIESGADYSGTSSWWMADLPYGDDSAPAESIGTDWSLSHAESAHIEDGFAGLLGLTSVRAAIQVSEYGAVTSGKSEPFGQYRQLQPLTVELGADAEGLYGDGPDSGAYADAAEAGGPED